MSVIDLVRTLMAEGVEFKTDGELIRWRSLEGRMTPERVAVLATAKPEIIDFLLGSITPARSIQDDAIEHYEERAAIREFDGGQTRTDAERSALADTAARIGLRPASLRQDWLSHPDAHAYLAFLVDHGPMMHANAASVIGWTVTRAWAAEARLRACGLLRIAEDRVGFALETHAWNLRSRV